jgi:hypothetical protein
MCVSLDENFFDVKAVTPERSERNKDNTKDIVFSMKCK